MCSIVIFNEVQVVHIIPTECCANGHISDHWCSVLLQKLLTNDTMLSGIFPDVSHEHAHSLLGCCLKTKSKVRIEVLVKPEMGVKVTMFDALMFACQQIIP